MARSTEEAVASDAALIVAVRHGDTDAYGELFRRHHGAAVAAARAIGASPSDAEDLASDAFARVLRTLQAGGGPDVAFRPYLLTAVRNAARDRARRRREDAVGDLPDQPGAGGFDDAERLAEAGLAASAFATLPERWQMVLWHTEVEGMTPAQVAPLLGIAPNAAAALAYRAREGLRQAYLQAHLRVRDDLDCRRCVEQLGAYVRDGLSARDHRRVDEHLEGCDSCRAILQELRDTNSTLRGALVPVVLGVPVGAYVVQGAAGVGLVARVAQLVARSPVLVVSCTAGITCCAGLLTWAALAPDDAPPAAVSVPAVSELSVAAATDEAAVRGGRLDVEVVVENAGSTSVSDAIVELRVPAGVTVVDANAPTGLAMATDADCSAAASCSLGRLDPGGAATVVWTLSVGAEVVGPLVLQPVVTEPAGAAVEAPPLIVDVVDPPA